MFKVPEELDGKVGVIGSGKGALGGAPEYPLLLRGPASSSASMMRAYRGSPRLLSATLNRSHSRMLAAPVLPACRGDKIPRAPEESGGRGGCG